MFDNWNRQRKIKPFRSDNVRCEDYNPDERTITLAAGAWQIQLGFNLVNYDQKLQLAFSGDLIASDGEALSRVMKVMWNQKLPRFSEDERLREQLNMSLPTTPPVNGDEGDDESSFADSETEAQPLPEPEPIYFRDMAGYVAGMPNEVVVTVKSSFRIDNN